MFVLNLCTPTFPTSQLMIQMYSIFLYYIYAYFVFGRMGSHVYKIYLQDILNARSYFIKSQLQKLYEGLSKSS